MEGEEGLWREMAKISTFKGSGKCNPAEKIRAQQRPDRQARGEPGKEGLKEALHGVLCLRL